MRIVKRFFVLIALALVGLSTASAQQQATAPAPLADGLTFRDCSDCPEMVVIPAGSFMMGSPAEEAGRGPGEGPQRKVRIPRFAAGKFEVTFGEWDACVAGGGCSGNPAPSDEGWGRGDRPVIGVSWDDAKEYVEWLARQTNQPYRLLSEAEWEYAARGGRQTAYWWGDWATHDYANYGSDACCSGLARDRDRWVETAPAGSFPANPFGLHDTLGNVWEWVEDCFAAAYRGAPSDGTAFITDGCAVRVTRGGGYYNDPLRIRAALRKPDLPSLRVKSQGFRVARTL